MLFSTSTDPYNGLGGVSTSFFADITPFLYIVLGVVLAFWLINTIIDIISPLDVLEKKRRREQKLQDEEDYDSVRDLVKDDYE